MSSKVLILSTLGIIVAAFVLWASPLSIGLKLKYGNTHQNDSMLLDAAQLLQNHRPNDQTALQQVIDIKLRVAEDQMASAYQIIGKMIEKAPNDPRYYVIRSRIYLMHGDPIRAVSDLSTAKDLTIRGGPKDEFTPTPTLIDDMIARIQRNRPPSERESPSADK